jgi:hypothetical protein
MNVAALAAAGSQVEWSGSGGIGAVSVGITSPVALLLLAIAIAGIIWPFWGIVRWKSGWRFASLMPLAVLGLAAVKGAYDAAHSAGSINVLPFYVLVTALFAGFYMIAVAIVRRIRLR